MWVTDPAALDRLAARLLTAGRAGFDTETFGQPDRCSPQYRAQIHCWSVAILGPNRCPRGYRRAGGVVLPAAALDHPALLDALRAIELWGHNAPHDEHAAKNRGTDLTVHDTLQWLRLACPGRPGYGLKEAEVWALGKKPRPDFDVMTQHEVPDPWYSTRHVKRCRCGAEPCRKPSKSTFERDGETLHHDRLKVPVRTLHERTKVERYPVTAFVPGAVMDPVVWNGKTEDRMALWWDYSAADAVSAIELVDWLETTVHPAASRAGAPGREYPW